MTTRTEAIERALLKEAERIAHEWRGRTITPGHEPPAILRLIEWQRILALPRQEVGGE